MSCFIAGMGFGGQHEPKFFGDRFELLEIVKRQIAPFATPCIQILQLFQSEARRDIAHVEFAAGIIDIAGAVG